MRGIIVICGFSKTNGMSFIFLVFVQKNDNSIKIKYTSKTFFSRIEQRNSTQLVFEIEIKYVSLHNRFTGFKIYITCYKTVLLSRLTTIQFIHYNIKRIGSMFYNTLLLKDRSH